MSKVQLDEQLKFSLMYPPDLELCKKHRLATRIWRGITSENMQTEICQCCGRKVGKQDVQVKCMNNSSTFSFLGPGIPLYFKFLKYSVFVLIIFTLIFSIYGLYTNLVQNSCTKAKNCTSTIWNSISIINKKDNEDYMLIQNYMLLVFVCVSLLILHVLRYRFRKVQEKIDQLDVSAGDYSIIIKRLPLNVNQEAIQEAVRQKIHEFHELQQGKPEIETSVINIQKIILSYNLTEYNKKKQDILGKFKQMALQQEEKQPSQKIKDFDFHKDMIQKPKQNGLLAIVVFQKQNSKNLLIRQPDFLQKVISYFFTPFSPLSDFRIKDQRVSVERAPQPDDIIWQNAHVSPCQRIQRKIFLNCISFILLFCGGICQYGLAVWQTQQTDSTMKTLVGTAASIVVTLTNFILKEFLTFSTNMEKIYTQTQYLDILTFKLISQQFLNSGVFVVAANILANLNDFDLEDSLPDTITQIMILNAITPNASTFIMKYFDIMGYVQRYLFIQKKIFFCTQLKANQLSELPKPDFPQKYSFIIKTLWLTAFYAPLVPIVIPISAVGLVINYYIEKFLFATSYSVSNKFGSTLNNSCIEGLEYIPLIVSIGQLLIYLYFQRFYYSATPSGWYIIIYICLALSFANLILPMKQFNQSIEACFNKQQKVKTENCIKAQPNSIPYIQAKKRFQVTYQMANPIYEQRRPIKRDTIIEKRMQQFFKKMASGDQQNKIKEHQEINFNAMLGMNHLSQESQSRQNLHSKLRNQEHGEYFLSNDQTNNLQDKILLKQPLASSSANNPKQNTKILVNKKKHEQKNFSSTLKDQNSQTQNIPSQQTPSLLIDRQKNKSIINNQKQFDPIINKTQQNMQKQPQSIIRSKQSMQQIKKFFQIQQQKSKSTLKIEQEKQEKGK